MTIRLKRRRAGWRRWLIASVAGCAVLGVAPSLLPGELWPPAPVTAPAPGPAALARGAVAAGAPAALPGLAVLIAEREARVRAHPRDARSWAVLGAAYVEQGRRTADPARYPKAERALRTALRLEESPAVLEGLAALAVARRDFPGAKRWGEAARRLAPERWTTQAVLIDAYTGLGDHKAVGRALERLVKLRPGTAAVRARKAAVYRDRGWREDAVAQITDAVAVARTPAERAAYLEQAGRLAFERGEREEALRYFREALRTDPDQRAAQAGQGRALAALGRTSEALTAYRAALDRQPRPEDALELGELYESLGLGRAARVQYDLLRERVRAAAAGGADEELVLGRFEAAHGDAAAAVRRLRAEWRRQPSTAVADALGWALYRDGRAGEALEYAVRATDGERGGGVRSAAYVYHRGMIEREVGRYGAARRHLQEALRINPWFSPLDAPRAREVSAELGEPSVESPPSG
ncbi:tetratricopeptide repeat protein [Streptomyces sp. NPDC090994]|uniref:tetratricopeptide repeat protein n=1 Tax=Streptomyces sp. NPDC090994 TaxID=3365969 RepID=UPI003823297C